MKKNILIESVQWYPFSDTEKIQQLTQDMMEHDRPSLLLFHPQENSLFFTGIVLKKYATAELTGASCIRRRVEEDGVVTFQFSRAALPSFMRYLSRQCVNIPDPIETDFFDFKSTLMDTDPPISSIVEEDPLPSKEDPYLTFLKTKTPASIEQELNLQIIGQPQLTKAVADFLYYHALRQQHPALPQRPLLRVLRAAAKPRFGGQLRSSTAIPFTSASSTGPISAGKVGPATIKLTPTWMRKSPMAASWWWTNSTNW